MERLVINRDQLAGFLKDFQSIKQFENLFQAVNDGQSSLEELIAQVFGVQAMAGDALAQIARIADALELLALAPRPVVATPDQPPMLSHASVQTMAAPALQSVPVTAYYPPAPSQAALKAVDIADFGISLPESRQTLMHDGAGRWRNDFVDLDDLGDVVITTPANKAALIYDTGTSKWIDGQLALDDLSDAYVSAPANGNVLIYNAVQSRFENRALSEGANIAITNGVGTITIATTGFGTMAEEDIGVSGTFTTVDGKTVTVVNGIVTSIV